MDLSSPLKVLGFSAPLGEEPRGGDVWLLRIILALWLRFLRSSLALSIQCQRDHPGPFPKQIRELLVGEFT